MTDPKILLEQVLTRHVDSDKWVNAPFEAIKRVSNTKVGSVGQDFLEELASQIGYTVEFPTNLAGIRLKQSPWDIQINGIKFELKTATEDVGGAFQFNHIRYHRAYDAVICIGISPSDIYFGIWTKADLATGKAGTLVSMEKSANASYKLTKKPNKLYIINDFQAVFDKFLLTWVKSL